MTIDICTDYCESTNCFGCPYENKSIWERQITDVKIPFYNPETRETVWIEVNNDVCLQSAENGN